MADSPFNERFGVLWKALLVAGVLVLLKWWVHEQGWAFITTVGLLIGLMGGVVFALAILLSGTIRDYKEAEQLLAQWVSQVRRTYWDLRLIIHDASDRDRLRGRLAAVVTEFQGGLEHGETLSMRRMHDLMDDIDTDLEKTVTLEMPAPLVRTVQVRLGELARITDRIEVIMETTFMRAGYFVAAAVIAVTLAGFTFADLGPLGEGLMLFGFAALLLVGLFLLVWDMENPFDGDVQIDTWQVDKLGEFLAVEGRTPS